jgi:hypothetical protein
MMQCRNIIRKLNEWQPGKCRSMTPSMPSPEDKSTGYKMEGQALGGTKIGAKEFGRELSSFLQPGTASIL